MAAGYNIDPVTGEMVLSPDGAVPMPAAMGGSDPLGSSVGMNQPYGPQYPHYGPWHAGGTPSGPIIPGPGFGASAGSVLQQTSPNRALNPATAQAPPLNTGFGQSTGGIGPIGSPAPAMPPPRPANLGAPQASYGSPWDPQGVGYAAAQRLAQQQQQGSPWDPQGAGYAAAQRLAQAPVQGPLAALGQQPNSPFTMVLRPNAPAESGGRGQGGTPLSTALDLSGYQPPPPPAPRSINLGYGAPGVTSAPGRAPQAQAQAQAQASGGYNPFTHVWRDAPANRVPVGQPIANTWAPGASGIVQGRGGIELLNPGADISLNNPKSAVSRFFHNPGNQYPVNAPF
jgi:hypothetical protein